MEKLRLTTHLPHDQLFDKTFQISAKSFYQVNTAQTEVLYQKAFELADLQPDDIVVDAYAGNRNHRNQFS